MCGGGDSSVGPLSAILSSSDDMDRNPHDTIASANYGGGNGRLSDGRWMETTKPEGTREMIRRWVACSPYPQDFGTRKMKVKTIVMDAVDYMFRDFHFPLRLGPPPLALVPVASAVK